MPDPITVASTAVASIVTGSFLWTRQQFSLLLANQEGRIQNIMLLAEQAKGRWDEKETELRKELDAAKDEAHEHEITITTLREQLETCRRARDYLRKRFEEKEGKDNGFQSDAS